MAICGMEEQSLEVKVTCEGVIWLKLYRVIVHFYRFFNQMMTKFLNDIAALNPLIV